VISHFDSDVKRRGGGPGPLSTRERILTAGRAGKFRGWSCEFGASLEHPAA